MHKAALYTAAFFLAAASVSGCARITQTTGNVPSTETTGSLGTAEAGGMEEAGTAPEAGTETESGRNNSGLDPDTFAYMTGEKQDDLSHLHLTDKIGPVAALEGDVSDYVLLPDAASGSFEIPEKIEVTDDIIKKRISAYLPYSSYWERSSLSDQFISMISGDTVYSVEDAIEKMRPVAERGAQVEQYRMIYNLGINSALENHPDEDYVYSIPDELVDGYCEYYQNDPDAYADMLEMSRDDFDFKYASEKKSMDIDLQEKGQAFFSRAMYAEYVIQKFGKEMTEKDYEQTAYDYLAVTNSPIRVTDDMTDYQVFMLRNRLRHVYAWKVLGKIYLEK